MFYIIREFRENCPMDLRDYCRYFYHDPALDRKTINFIPTKSKHRKRGKFNNIVWIYIINVEWFIRRSEMYTSCYLFLESVVKGTHLRITWHNVSLKCKLV